MSAISEPKRLKTAADAAAAAASPSEKQNPFETLPNELVIKILNFAPLANIHLLDRRFASITLACKKLRFELLRCKTLKAAEFFANEQIKINKKHDNAFKPLVIITKLKAQIDLKEAESTLENISDPSLHVSALVELAKVKASQGLFSDATQDLNKAIVLTKNNPPSFWRNLYSDPLFFSIFTVALEFNRDLALDTNGYLKTDRTQNESAILYIKKIAKTNLHEAFEIANRIKPRFKPKALAEIAKTSDDPALKARLFNEAFAAARAQINLDQKVASLLAIADCLESYHRDLFLESNETASQIENPWLKDYTKTKIVQSELKWSPENAFITANSIRDSEIKIDALISILKGAPNFSPPNNFLAETILQNLLALENSVLWKGLRLYRLVKRSPLPFARNVASHILNPTHKGKALAEIAFKSESPEDFALLRNYIKETRRLHAKADILVAVAKLAHKQLSLLNERE